MAGRLRKREVGGGVAVVAAVWAVFALAAPAQQPPPEVQPPSLLPDVGPVAPVKLGEAEKPPPLTFDEPDPEVQVLPAQFTFPGGLGQPNAPGQPGGSPARTVPDPPYPVVRIQVRVPADSPPGDDIKYLVTVQNVSAADAHAVTVRNPIPKTATFVKAEPEADKAQSTAEQLVWAFGTLPAGKAKTIELTLKPRPDAGEVKNLAYVKYEHGQAVTTRINKPAVKVSKAAPKQTVRDEAYSVRVLVENTGKVPAENVKVVENVPTSAEVELVTRGGVRSKQSDGQQYVWEIARLMPGERKVIEYRLTAREAKDVSTLTNLSAAKNINETAAARTLVLVPGLAVKLTGPTTPVAPGEAAKYEIVVRNPGTLPCANVRVTGTLPADCKPTKKTEGGQLYRDAIVWAVPRLEPGEAQAFRFEMKATTTGRRVVVASAVDARNQRAAEELDTVFQGTAALVWETDPKPAAVAVGRQGTFTVRVRNNGGEAARNVKVEVDIPDAVTVVQTTPTTPVAGNKLAFAADEVPAYGEKLYTITYEAKQAAQAWFKLKMTADCLGTIPLTTEKAVSITGGG